MTDRELHELAAKAAGIEVWWTEHYGGVLLRCATSPVIWRPLKDDSDALRLAVQLQIEIRVFNGKAHAGKQGQFWCTEQCDSDPCAATRRAIVRAAARIWTKHLPLPQAPAGDALDDEEVLSMSMALLMQRDAEARDAARYRGMRDKLYGENISIGEATLIFKVTGNCPDISEFDAGIDAAIAAQAAKGE